MIIAQVQVSGTRCTVAQVSDIPRGLVGATVSIEYTDSVWDGLTKTVVFRGCVTKDVLNAGEEVTVPAEVVSRAGGRLYMGVYGVDAENNVVIPTIWAELGLIHGAAAPSGDSSTDQSLPVWAQLQAMIGDLDKLDTAAKSSLVAAVNEALLSGGGTVSPAAVQKIVDDYLKANPPADGKDGKDGVTPNIQIGTVTTLPAGSDATASMSGTAENPLLNLGIPKGEAGQGGGSGWVKICNITIDDNSGAVAGITVDKLPDGTPLAGLGIKELRFAMSMQLVSESSYSYGTFQVNNAKSITVGQNFAVNTNAQSWFRGSVALLTDGYASAEWANGNQAGATSMGGGIIINPHYYGANLPDVEDQFNDDEISKISIVIPKAKDGTAENMKSGRLVVVGR